MDNNKQTYKITDEEFKEAYSICKGNCALTALYIQENYNISYSRQAVYKRAKNFPELVLQDMVLFTDSCHAGLLTFADDEKNDVRLRARIYTHLLDSVQKTLRKLHSDEAKNLFTKFL
jgi:hypothetical protein